MWIVHRVIWDSRVRVYHRRCFCEWANSHSSGNLAKKHGLKNTKAELQKVIKQTAKVQHAYDIQKFSLLPLLDPQAINCYYFRNKNGLLFGELEPYFTTSDNEIAVDYTNYWSGWKKQLPNFHVMDVDSSNHMMFLSESKVSETISDFCENLYSEEGITENFLKSFKRKTKRKHGTLDLKTIKSKNKKNKREQEAKNLSGNTLKKQEKV